ncbi:MAG TPA: hypothetical protein VI861_03100 [Rickettsiales bacterium]|nr:hypothetical protein [Rickettsiales bacterium]
MRTPTQILADLARMEEDIRRQNEVMQAQQEEDIRSGRRLALKEYTLGMLPMQFEGFKEAYKSRIQAIANNDPSVRAQDFTANWKMDSDILKLLCEALKKNTHLQALNLSFNSIGDAGAIALAEALKVNKTLKVLNISYCDIKDEGMTALKKVLRARETLQIFDGTNQKDDVEEKIMEATTAALGAVDISAATSDSGRIVPRRVVRPKKVDREQALETEGLKQITIGIKDAITCRRALSAEQLRHFILNIADIFPSLDEAQQYVLRYQIAQYVRVLFYHLPDLVAKIGVDDVGVEKLSVADIKKAGDSLVQGQSIKVASEGLFNELFPKGVQGLKGISWHKYGPEVIVNLFRLFLEASESPEQVREYLQYLYSETVSFNDDKARNSSIIEWATNFGLIKGLTKNPQRKQRAELICNSVAEIKQSAISPATSVAADAASSAEPQKKMPRVV